MTLPESMNIIVINKLLIEVLWEIGCQWKQPRFKRNYRSEIWIRAHVDGRSWY